MENGQDAQDDRRATDTGPKPQLLPHDLDRALTYLPEDELQRLAEAVAFETRRRKWLRCAREHRLSLRLERLPRQTQNRRSPMGRN